MFSAPRVHVPGTLAVPEDLNDNFRTVADEMVGIEAAWEREWGRFPRGCVAHATNPGIGSSTTTALLDVPTWVSGFVNRDLRVEFDAEPHRLYWASLSTKLTADSAGRSMIAGVARYHGDREGFSDSSSGVNLLIDDFSELEVFGTARGECFVANESQSVTVRAPFTVTEPATVTIVTIFGRVDVAGNVSLGLGIEEHVLIVEDLGER